MPRRARTSRSPLTLVAAAVLSIAAACGGKDATQPAAPTLASISIVQRVDTLAELDVRQLTVAGVDSKGQPMAPAGVTWASSDTSVATVDASGNLAGVQPGSATITARSGSVAATLPVRVVAVPVRGLSLRLVGGIGADTVLVGTSATMIAEAHDANGRLLRGRTVDVAVVDSTRASIDAAGKVTGLSVGLATFVARHDTVTRRSVLVVRPPFAARIAIRLADPKRLGDTTWMGLRDSVLVTFSDSAGQPLAPSPFRPVTFTTDDPLVAVVDPYGTVRLTGTGTATIRASGERMTAARSVVVVRGPITDVLAAPDTVRVLPGETTVIRPIIIDGGGVRVTSLGGHTLRYEALTPSRATVDAQGNVKGVAVGDAAVRVSIGKGVFTVPVKVLAPATGSGAFNIALRFVGPEPSAEVRDAFAAAKARWESVIRESTGTETFLWPRGSCGKTDSTSVESVTDVLILARIDSIDGPSKVLGSAGPCGRKELPSGRWISMIGRMTFDSADMNTMAASGRLQNVIAHEMGHVLGIGTMWSAQYHLGRALAQQGGFNPSYLGLSGIAASAGMGFTSFSIAATGAPTLDRVPLEDTGGSGTAGAHWRRSVFGNELMNGWAGSGLQPLSLLTVAAMADLGYAVSTSAAEAWGTFIVGGPSANVLARYLGTQPERIHEVLEEPELQVDRGGRVRMLKAPRR